MISNHRPCSSPAVLSCSLGSPAFTQVATLPAALFDAVMVWYCSQLFLMGGRDATRMFNTVFSSYDATYWSIRSQATWTPRYGHAACVAPIGGGAPVSFGPIQQVSIAFVSACVCVVGLESRHGDCHGWTARVSTVYRRGKIAPQVDATASVPACVLTRCWFRCRCGA